MATMKDNIRKHILGKYQALSYEDQQTLRRMASARLEVVFERQPMAFEVVEEIVQMYDKCIWDVTKAPVTIQVDVLTIIIKG